MQVTWHARTLSSAPLLKIAGPTVLIISGMEASMVLAGLFRQKALKETNETKGTRVDRTYKNRHREGENEEKRGG